jgi:hypothetical protein
MTKLEKTKKDLEDFLNNHPNMRNQQMYLERMLNMQPDPISRMKLIVELLKDNLEELEEKVLELQDLVKEVNHANTKLRKK